MVLLFMSHWHEPEPWRLALVDLLPDLVFRVWPDIGEAREIDFLLVSRPERGIFNQLTQLKCILSIGAGVDLIVNDPELPADVPVVKLVDANLTRAMSEYVLLAVLRYHRQLPSYERFQRDGAWRKLAPPDTDQRRIGIMGFGALGRDAAQKLAALGFPVAAWTRRARTHEVISCYHGEAGLAEFLARTDILVCLLPLTPETDGLLNAQTFARLPEGAFVINCARGRQVVEEDLIAALESGHLGGATLDVFDEEPLPAGHPFWRHPNVTITPHISALTDPRSAARGVAETIRRVRAGVALADRVDLAVGY